MHELFERTPARKKMVVLENADHYHFCDRVEEAHELFRRMPHTGESAWMAQMPPITELCPAKDAHLAVRGLALAHLDAALKEDSVAAAFLEGDIPAVLGTRGVRVAAF